MKGKSLYFWSKMTKFWFLSQVQSWNLKMNLNLMKINNQITHLKKNITLLKENLASPNHPKGKNTLDSWDKIHQRFLPFTPLGKSQLATGLNCKTKASIWNQTMRTCPLLSPKRSLWWEFSMSTSITPLKTLCNTSTISLFLVKSRSWKAKAVLNPRRRP